MPAFKETNRLLTVTQVAREIGINDDNGRRRVRRLIRAGKLQAEDHGTGDQAYWLIDEGSLKRYLRERGRG
ncbi:MAG: hypothetical protein CL793_07430 [Chloroflexi bacterium]|nr:hypothetical protein [Chloroflexota bacterium]|tara:strand:+ start:8764 stop:8976 length:213 start_codon:yes stop_codon:yes gene_type:complete